MLDYASEALADEFPGIENLFGLPRNRGEQSVLAAAQAQYEASAQYEAALIELDLPANFRARMQALINDINAANNAADASGARGTGSTSALRAAIARLNQNSKKLDAINRIKYRGNRRQLTTNAQVDARGMCISPDGKHLVFVSWRNGKSNLWRMTADGANLTQLTDGESDGYPSCSPDNRTVIFQRGLMTKPKLWKVPLAGGEAVQLTASNAKWSAIANDGSRVSYFFMADDKWRFGIVSPEGGEPVQVLDVPATLKESVIRWSPDNQSLFYISRVGSVGNIRAFPLDGSEDKPLTDFKSHAIDDFALSPDGKQLAIARSLTVSDVVLITNDRESKFPDKR